MARFKVGAAFTVPLALLVPTVTKTAGVETKSFPAVSDGIRINGNFRTYGGTDSEVNGVYSVIDTAVCETWYRPDITSACRIAVLNSGAVYEILGEPENIELRNQYLRIRLRRVQGGA